MSNMCVCFAHFPSPGYPSARTIMSGASLDNRDLGDRAVEALAGMLILNISVYVQSMFSVKFSLY
jgi:hypothetical protein